MESIGQWPLRLMDTAPIGINTFRSGLPGSGIVAHLLAGVDTADDFLVFTKTSEAAQRVARSIETYLTRKLKLVINHQKSRICKTDGVEFLGFAFQGYGGHFPNLCSPALSLRGWQA